LNLDKLLIKSTRKRALLLASVVVIWAAMLGACTSKVLPQSAGVHFSISPLKGIPVEEGVSRRDPSDVIFHEGLYYLWYTKSITTFGGYDATIWYATSKDGINWAEQGEAIARGQKNAWDSHSVFTPNILYTEGRFYLFYTGVTHTKGQPEGVFQNNIETDTTAIGVAVSRHPAGPFTRASVQPVLAIDDSEAKNFDSYRVDDASLVAQEGRFLLYYKGRSYSDGREGPRKTKMGVAISDNPTGPYKRYNGNPITEGGHEVMAWPAFGGVMTLLSNTGEEGEKETLQYAEDGTSFEYYTNIPSDYPHAPGIFRSDGFIPGENIDPSNLWGISMSYGNRSENIWPHLMRYEIEFSE